MHRFRQKYLLLVMLALWLPLSACQCQTKTIANTNSSTIKTAPVAPKVDDTVTSIYLTYQDYEIAIILAENEYVTMLREKLPLTLTLTDFQAKEKVAALSDEFKLPTVQSGFDPVIGDVAIYAPWGNLAFYYQDQPYADGLIHIGHIQTGQEYLSNIPNNQEVTLSFDTSKQ